MTIYFSSKKLVTSSSRQQNYLTAFGSSCIFWPL